MPQQIHQIHLDKLFYANRTANIYQTTKTSIIGYKQGQGWKYKEPK